MQLFEMTYPSIRATYRGCPIVATIDSKGLHFKVNGKIYASESLNKNLPWPEQLRLASKRIALGNFLWPIDVVETVIKQIDPDDTTELPTVENTVGDMMPYLENRVLDGTTKEDVAEKVDDCRCDMGLDGPIEELLSVELEVPIENPEPVVIMNIQAARRIASKLLESKYRGEPFGELEGVQGPLDERNTQTLNSYMDAVPKSSLYKKLENRQSPNLPYSERRITHRQRELMDLAGLNLESKPEDLKNSVSQFVREKLLPSKASGYSLQNILETVI